MLSDFFRINLPYCIERVEGDKWRCLNREYQPLGMNTRNRTEADNSKLPISTSYERLTENFIQKLVDGRDKIHRDDAGQIYKFFLYDDGTNPMNQAKESTKLWDAYFDKLKKLSRLKRKDRYDRY